MLIREELTNDILDLIGAGYYLRNGQETQGQSISYLMSELRGRGWKNLGNLNDLESLVEKLGFRMDEGQSKRFGKPHGRFARIVTL